MSHLHPPTRSHLRLYTPTSTSHSKQPSSTIFPLHPPGPTIATYAIRHNTASDTENVGLVAGRLWNDEELRTPPPPLAAEEGMENAREGDCLGEGKDEAESEQINILDSIRRQRKREQEELDLTSPALLLLHVYPSGTTFLEALPPPPHIPTTISLLRLPHGHTTAPARRQPTTIPPSHPPNHIFIPLDSDCRIIITTNKHTHKLLYQTIEMSIAVPSTSEDNNTGVEIYSTGREYTEDRDNLSRSGGDTEQRKKQRGEGGEEVEGGLSTPPPGLDGKEVTRVLDTPHAHDKQKSKFSDERLVLEETEGGESTLAGLEPTPDETTRRLFNDRGEENKPGAGEHLVLDDDDVTGDEDEDVIPTMPADMATLPRSDTRGVSAPVSFIGTLPPSSGGAGVGSPMEGELLIAKSTPPMEEGGEGEQEEELSGSLLSSLPAVAQDIRKLRHTPAGLKTYGHRRGTPGHEKKQKKKEVEVLGEEKGSPKSLRSDNQGNSNTNAKINAKGNGKRKGKAPEREIEESSQIARGEKEQEDMDIDEEEKEPEVSQTVGRRPQLKRPRKEAITATPGKRKRGLAKKQEEIAESADEDEACLEEEVEAEEIVEKVIEQVKSARKKKAKQKEKGEKEEKKENKKPPKKKARMAIGKAEKEDSGMNTQYTFHGSDEEVKEEEKADSQLPSPPPVKTPAKRGRKSLAVAVGIINTPSKPFVIPPSTSTSPNHAAKTTSPYSGPAPKIVFSNSTFPDRKDATSILRALGVRKTQKVTEKGVTHLVVGSGGLVRSSKLALALTLGLDIITDSWLLDSYNSPQAELLDAEPYTPADASAEQNWGFNLPSAIARGKSGQLATLLEGYEVVYLTPLLVAHLKFSDQESGFLDILKATGAGRVLKRAPKGSVEEEGLREGKGLIFGVAEGEKEVEVVRWRGGGWGVFRVEMVTMSILRGRLECGEEFGIEGGGGKGRRVRGVRRGGVMGVRKRWERRRRGRGDRGVKGGGGRVRWGSRGEVGHFKEACSGSGLFR
ncbi:hypothetical protein BGX38DRAFT_1261142 [Terfezia claveryi]|nr:hypothetical protein BGX38DRAFT_1261142 [Terfezia claveryi]